jgi:hypothetical protein
VERDGREDRRARTMTLFLRLVSPSEDIDSSSGGGRWWAVSMRDFCDMALERTFNLWFIFLSVGRWFCHEDF